MTRGGDSAEPTFIIGGAPRSGTTFLCHALDRHPDIYMAKPYTPEPKVFLGPARDPAGYRRTFEQLFGAARHYRARGEKSSRYLESEEACWRIRAHLPGIRLVFSVREPVARAYSNYLWSTKNGIETLPFADAVDREGQRTSVVHDDARPFDYLIRGAYDVFAERYYAAFGRNAVLFVVYEDLMREPERVLALVHAFVGVEPRSLAVGDLGLVNSAREVGPPLDPALQARLRDRMTPAVQHFQRLTGLDVRAWGYG
ncbi:MAG TPA: sulfotransferase [Methylomirabilota bacterium]|nr:sulfotransferase [Methylomirabilota bacterium]